MEDGILGFLFGCLVALYVGLVTYAVAEGTMKQRAIDAGVACYVATNGARSEFKFNCGEKK